MKSAALLIVDDNEDNRYTLTRRLMREGYTDLTTAADGREALRLLQTRRFDLVLLDIMMPDVTGFEVLEQLKARGELHNIPVIMISALTEIESVVRCIELGAVDYLPKPFNPTLLRARVNASLEKKRLRDEVQSTLARLAEEMEAARKLQLGMLPRAFPEHSAERPVDVHAFIEPASEVGGDLYDCFYAGEHLFCFSVGDVSGKGAAAALFMARTRSLVRMGVELWVQFGVEMVTGHIAAAVNRELCQNNDDRMFVSLFLGLLDTRTGRMSYTNAGHPFPILLSPSGGAARMQGKPDLPLGVRSRAAFETHAVQLEPGATVFVMSDGIIEAMNAEGDLYGLDRLIAALGAAAKTRAADLVASIAATVRAFTGEAPKSDDVTALALRWLPARSHQISDQLR